ncbi:MAG: PIN domain-containing protein, partial [Desulfobacterales bacterium]|nr:PIN domain-containing protein [Desulfobacterales bacterium]
LIFLPMPYTIFLRSAEIYRTLRKKGITIRKSIDCMIASVALENDIPILHNDKDFSPIEKHFGLKTLLLSQVR